MLSAANNTSNASCHREEILRAARNGIHQPSMPFLVMLMGTDAWKQGILHTMSIDGFSDAPDGLGRMDQGALGKKKFRILRDIVRNKDGKVVEPDLQANAPMQFRLLQILAEEYGITHVAFQEMDEQAAHCDPYSKYASKKRDARSCHVLVTCLGCHRFLLSTSPKIASLDKRYTFWGENGGCAAVKVESKDLRDCLLIPRQGEKPLQAILHTLLGGITDDDKCIPLHAGVPSGSAGIGEGWVSSKEYVQYQQGRNQVFRAGGMVETSVSLICNFPGTQEAAAAAFEKAAAQVIQEHEGPLDALQDVPSQRSMCDLESYKEMMKEGNISNLSFKNADYWDEKRKEEQRLCCEERGGSQRGLMSGKVKEDHTKASVDGGGCQRGCMSGKVKDDHTKSCEDGGGSQHGRMSGDKLEAHCAALAKGFAKRNALLFQLANGKLEGPKWKLSCIQRSNVVLYTISNGVDDPIEGKRNFEAYLLKNYKPEMLTDDGKLALEAMKKKRDKNDKKIAKKKAA
jgi:hypothetical protein